MRAVGVGAPPPFFFENRKCKCAESCGSGCIGDPPGQKIKKKSSRFSGAVFLKKLPLNLIGKMGVFSSKKNVY